VDALLLREPPLIVLPRLAVKVGLNEAMLLQQLHYKTLLGNNTFDVSVRTSVDKLQREFPFWSKSTVERTLKSLKDHGLIYCTRAKGGTNIELNYDAINGLATGNRQIDGSDPTETLQSDGSQPVNLTVPARAGDTGTSKKEDLRNTLGGDGQLFETPGSEPAPSKEPQIQALWDEYLAVFGDRFKVKSLTAPRKRSLSRALSATDDNLGLCKRAIHGLKSYRDSHPSGSKDVSPSVIFETGPHSGRTLTDQIEWWAEQAEVRGAGEQALPSLRRDEVVRRKIQVVDMYAVPDVEWRITLGEEARDWLRANARIEPVIEGEQVTGWREIAA
jgi:hypothetical protein